MADLSGRSGWEARLQAAVAGLQPGQLQRLMAEIRAQANLQSVTIPESLWAEFNAETQAAITPILEQIFIESAREAAVAYPTLAVNWALVNAQAATWASGYAFDLVKLIDDTTRSGLQEAISAYFKTATTMGDLRTALAQFTPTIQDTLGRTLYSVNRASMIATTEVTRAATQGELQWAQIMHEENPDIRVVEIWQTNRDELVCPKCGPRQGKRIKGNDFPPAHPRCRCWTNTQLVGA